MADDTLVTLNHNLSSPTQTHQHFITDAFTVSVFHYGNRLPQEAVDLLFGDTQNPTGQGPEQPAPSLICFEWEGGLGDFQRSLPT